MISTHCMGADRVILVGNSRGWGLTYYNTVLAVAMKRAGIPLVVLSTPGEQSPGLHDKLRAFGISVIDDPALEVTSAPSILRASQVVGSLCVPGTNVLVAEGVRHTIAAWLAKRRLRDGRQLFITTLLGAMRNASRVWPLYYAAGSAVLNIAADKVLLLCGEEKRKMLRCGLRPSKAAVGYFPVDDETWSEAKPDFCRFAESVNDSRVYDGSRRKVIYLAQFWRHKRHEPLIRAWEEVARRHPELLLVLAGSGPMFEECRALTKRLGLDDKICLLPRIPREAVPGLLSLCSYGVVTSKAETFGSCIVEPLLAGLPVCTVAVGIARELAAVGGVHLLSTVAPNALAEELTDFFSDDNRAHRQMKRGRSWVVDQCGEAEFVRRLRNEWAERPQHSAEFVSGTNSNRA